MKVKSKMDNSEVMSVKLIYLVVFLFLISFTSATISLNLTTPTNNTYSNNLTQTLLSSVNSTVNLSNATIYIWNSSGDLYNVSSIYTTKTALGFDGVTNKYVTIGDSAGDFTNPQQTISLWFYMNDKTTKVHYGLIEKLNHDAVWEFFIANPDKNLFMRGGGVSPSLTGTTALNASQWYHAVAVWNGTSANLYLNGVLDGTGSVASAPASGSGNIIIGTTYRLSSYSYDLLNGSIDEVVIWNRSLNSTEISQLYNYGSGLYIDTSIAPFNSGLVAGYHFDEGSGAIAYDITTRYNGTLIGSPLYSSGIISRSISVSNSTLAFVSGIYNATISSIVNFVNGVYTWTYQVFDSVGTSSTSSNYTLTIDNILPTLESLTPANNTSTGNTSINFSEE